MLAQTVICPGCRVELKLKAAMPAGMTSAKCPRCGVMIPLVPAQHPPSDTDASVADRTHRAPGDQPLPAVYAFLAPPEQSDEIGRLAHYRVLAELGRGGMGIVFRAEDAHLRRLVALKVMLPQYAANPTDKARFLREARAQAQVEHDHVATIFQVSETGVVPFLAMPLLRGMSLADALRANPQVPLPSAVRIAREMADGLACAHDKGLIHRDIKPGNVWLEGKHLRVKILDFGLARQEADAGEAVTQKGAVLGTPAYMSPEQARGQALDHRSDLFSLGTVLYQMMTGKQPFRSQNTTGVLIAVATEMPPPPSTLQPAIPPALDALTMALLAKDPAGRPPSAEAVAAHLRAIEADMRAGMGPVSGTGYHVVPLQLQAAPGVVDPWSDLDITEVEPVATQSAEPRPVDAPKSRPLVARVQPKSTQTSGDRRKMFLAAAAIALAVVGVVAAAVVYVKNDIGTVTVDINDIETETRYRNGKLVLLSGGNEKYTLSAAERSLSAAPGKYTVRIDGADGVIFDPPEIIVKRGEKVPVRLSSKKIVVPPPPPPPPTGEADRKAAIAVINGGGNVRINDARPTELRGAIKFTRDLPTVAFRLTYIDLSEASPSAGDLTAMGAALKDCKNVTGLNLTKSSLVDADLVHFKDLTDLSELRLKDTLVTGIGLAHFKNCKKLNTLSLNNVKVGDTGLAHFKDCKDELTLLDLAGATLTDKGLIHFKGSKGLKFLNLATTGTTNEGLVNFADNKDLTTLWLANLPITDAALAPFGECVNLSQLSLAGTKATDKGLAHFKNCRSLTDVQLAFTEITDDGLQHLKGNRFISRVLVGGTKITNDGLAHLAGCRDLTELIAYETALTDDAVPAIVRFTKLEKLNVKQTKLTRDGVLKIRKALPRCEIIWNEGTVGANVGAPGTDTDRAAAEYIVSIGGSFRINYETRTRKSGPLPVGALALSYAHLADNKLLTDEGLAAFAGCQNLGYLSLGRTAVRDTGLAHFKDCRNLTSLHLYETDIGDDGVVHFRDCTKLYYLNVGKTKVTDVGLANFKDCTNMYSLQVWDTKVTDIGLAHFKDHPRLAILSAYKTAITDKGLAHFKDCAALLELTVHDTMVTDAGLAHFKGKTNLLRLSVSGPSITNDGLLNFRDCTRLTKLSVPNTKVTDAGLQPFGGCKNLMHLTLSGTAVTDMGLGHFKDCDQLAELYLADTGTTDTGFAQFKECSRLTKLSLGGTKVTDDGLAHLKNYRALAELNLADTKVTDATLTRLTDCKFLTVLDVRKTKVTKTAVGELATALPNCRIEWDGGTIVPPLP